MLVLHRQTPSCRAESVTYMNYLTRLAIKPATRDAVYLRNYKKRVTKIKKINTVNTLAYITLIDCFTFIFPVFENFLVYKEA